MPLVSMAQALADLERHMPAFFEITNGAWQDYHSKISQECQLIFNATARANNVHAFMIERASRYAEACGAESVKLFRHQQMQGLVIDQRYAIRFKKLNEDNKSRNQPSQQVRRFRDQIEFPDFPKAHHLELGYVLDDSQAKFLESRLVSPSGEGYKWFCKLSPAEAVPKVVDIFELAEVEEVEAEVVPREKVVQLRKTDEN